MSLSTAGQRVAAVLQAESSSKTAAVLAAVSQIVSLIVGFGIINSAQEGAIIALTTAGVNLGGLIAHAIHTGKINPSATETYALALVTQGVFLLVSFAVIGKSTAATVVAVTVAVLTAGIQVAHALQSKKVPAVVPTPVPMTLGEVEQKPVEIAEESIKALAAAVKAAIKKAA